MAGDEYPGRAGCPRALRYRRCCRAVRVVLRSRSYAAQLSSIPHTTSVTVFQALILGIIQGLSEFLPISSSAHLALAPWILHWPDPGLAFDVALHFGTLLAVLWYFWAEWIRLLIAAKDIVVKRRIETETE